MIMIGSSENRGGVVVGVLCAEQNVMGSNLALYYDILFHFSKFFLSSCRISVHNEIPLLY